MEVAAREVVFILDDHFHFSLIVIPNLEAAAQSHSSFHGVHRAWPFGVPPPSPPSLYSQNASWPSLPIQPHANNYSVSLVIFLPKYAIEVLGLVTVTVYGYGRTFYGHLRALAVP